LKKINSSERAYWLGFCCADAYNSGDALILELSEKDRNHLEYFRLDIESDTILRSRIRNNKTYSILYLSSRKMCGDLISHGYIPKKSNVLKMPNIDKLYYRDFARGIFDGDGCISLYRNNKQAHVSIFTGSTCFANKFGEMLKDFGINTILYKQKME
jgi:intein/homing endonuclease